MKILCTKNSCGNRSCTNTSAVIVIAVMIGAVKVVIAIEVTVSGIDSIRSLR